MQINHRHSHKAHYTVCVAGVCASQQWECVFTSAASRSFLPFVPAEDMTNWSEWLHIYKPFPVGSPRSGISDICWPQAAVLSRSRETDYYNWGSSFKDAFKWLEFSRYVGSPTDASPCCINLKWLFLCLFLCGLHRHDAGCWWNLVVSGKPVPALLHGKWRWKVWRRFWMLLQHEPVVYAGERGQH